ncbi:hypothetical protein B0T25DRAFT_9642 [Lasiosphaeria hispida]|uniref:Heterokaryon incompatibility domain-containing protein n=1 Tax=Lasiosphaeria hispida TaxID=260671 RepID=A0AAJ0MJE6_9PEZI|nr:hypothetical protein B0T25DRAFT_9642 [Lasiosphaeria hispida]
MRLLHAETKKLVDFLTSTGEHFPTWDENFLTSTGEHFPTWGENEVTYSNVARLGSLPPDKKIDGCCRQALANRLEYVWIDTICIDKSSSAELSEAINSMFACAFLLQVDGVSESTWSAGVVQEEAGNFLIQRIICGTTPTGGSLREDLGRPRRMMDMLR